MNLFDVILAKKIEAKHGGGGGITPSGTIDIYENGEQDVTNYATANVDVSAQKNLPLLVIRNDSSASVDVGIYEATISGMDMSTYSVTYAIGTVGTGKNRQMYVPAYTWGGTANCLIHAAVSNDTTAIEGLNGTQINFEYSQKTSGGYNDRKKVLYISGGSPATIRFYNAS